jgi:hypothetical protein
MFQLKTFLYNQEKFHFENLREQTSLRFELKVAEAAARNLGTSNLDIWFEKRKKAAKN